MDMGGGRAGKGKRVRVVKENIPTTDLGPNSHLFLGSLREALGRVSRQAVTLRLFSRNFRDNIPVCQGFAADS